VERDMAGGFFRKIFLSQDLRKKTPTDKSVGREAAEIRLVATEVAYRPSSFDAIVGMALGLRGKKAR
jgi:hypothetical protein